MNIKLAIIGMGNMGCNYAKMIIDNLVCGVEIAAVTRISPQRKEMLQEVFSKEIPIYSSADALYDAVRQKVLEIDGVLIATPHLLHAEKVIEAMQLGLHVLCDKPAGVYGWQARKMREEAVMHKGIVFGMVFHQRIHPAYVKIREIVTSGIYGKLKRVNWVKTDWYRPEIYYEAVSWRGTWDKEGGGLVLNQCAHSLDILQWIFGMPIQVQAFCKEGKYHNIEVEDEVTAYLEYPEGVTGIFYSTTGEASGINRLEISLDDALLVYEQGELKVRELGIHEPEYRKYAQLDSKQPKGVWKSIVCEGEDKKQEGILQNFIDAVQGNTKLWVDGAEGSKSLILSNALYLSSWKKKMIQIPKCIEEELELEAAFEEEMKKKIGKVHLTITK